MISVRNYNKTKENRRYGAHTMCVELPHIQVWFSYETPIAFATRDGFLHIRKNEWGPTTGQQMRTIRSEFQNFTNIIEGIDKAAFEDLLEMRLLETATKKTVIPGDFSGRILTKLRHAKSKCKMAQTAFQWETAKVLSSEAEEYLNEVIEQLNKIRYKLKKRGADPRETAKRGIIL